MPLTKDPSSVTCEDPRVGIGFTMLHDAQKVVVWVDKGSLRVLHDSCSCSSDEALLELRRTLPSKRWRRRITTPALSSQMDRRSSDGTMSRSYAIKCRASLSIEAYARQG